MLGAPRRDPEVILCVLLACLASHGTSPTHLRVLTTPTIMICEMVSLAYMAPSCLGTFGPMRAFVVQTRWIVECLTRLPCERRWPVLLWFLPFGDSKQKTGI